MPGSLNHINLWLLDDDGGHRDRRYRAQHRAGARGLGGLVRRARWPGARVTRILCTHFHPDHLGLAGWLAERFGVRLWMTRGEWLFGRMLTADVRDAPPAEARA